MTDTREQAPKTFWNHWDSIPIHRRSGFNRVLANNAWDDGYAAAQTALRAEMAGAGKTFGEWWENSARWEVRVQSTQFKTAEDFEQFCIELGDDIWTAAQTALREQHKHEKMLWAVTAAAPYMEECEKLREECEKLREELENAAKAIEERDRKISQLEQSLVTADVCRDAIVEQNVKHFDMVIRLTNIACDLCGLCERLLAGKRGCFEYPPTNEDCHACKNKRKIDAIIGGEEG